MSILPVIKAPLAVQLYRVAFAACVIYFGSFVWQERRIGSFVGLLELQAFTFCSLLGLIYNTALEPMPDGAFSSAFAGYILLFRHGSAFVR